MHVILSLSKSNILLRYLELSITIALLTVWPHCDVPPPLANNGMLFSLEKFTVSIKSFFVFGTNTP